MEQDYSSQLPHPQTKESAGPLVGALLILALLIIGGIYIFNNQQNKTTRPQDIVVDQETASSTDPIQEIERDLNQINPEQDLTELEEALTE